MAKGTELSRLRLDAHESDVVLGQTDGSHPTLLSQPLAPMSFEGSKLGRYGLSLEDMDSCACTVVFESTSNVKSSYLPSGRIHGSSSATRLPEDVSSFACPLISKTTNRCRSCLHASFRIPHLTGGMSRCVVQSTAHEGRAP
jgi:hypothetical protein